MERTRTHPPTFTFLEPWLLSALFSVPHCPFSCPRSRGPEGGLTGLRVSLESTQ